MLGNVGPMEIVVVLIIALVVFGPKRLPELGNSLGKGLREFKGSISGEDPEPHSPKPTVTPIAASTPPVQGPVVDAEVAEEQEV